MKQLIVITLFTVFVTFVWEWIGKDAVYRTYLIEQKTLDFSTPFSGKIDLEFLKELRESTATPTNQH